MQTSSSTPKRGTSTRLPSLTALLRSVNSPKSRSAKRTSTSCSSAGNRIAAVSRARESGDTIKRSGGPPSQLLAASLATTLLVLVTGVVVSTFLGVHARRRTTWRHFSTAERVLFLRAAARDPGVGRRLRRSLRRWIVLGGAALALGLALLGHSLVGSLAADRVMVDLRLGRYAEAARRVAAGAAVSPAVAALVDNAAALTNSPSNRCTVAML